MTEDPRGALERLIDAFHEHLAVARTDDADALEAAEDALRDAFFTYDDELFTTYGVELPFDLLDDDYEEGDEDDDESEEGSDDEFVDVDD